MAFEKGERGGEHGGVVQPLLEVARVQTRHVDQPHRAARVGERPHQRAQADGRRVRVGARPGGIGVCLGRQAVARARDTLPDLIVMDIQMPHVTGDALIAELKAAAETRAIPIMAVTAYAGRGDEERIRAAGADAYVSKPIGLVRFVESVRALA